MQLTEQLLTFGLSDKEADVYLAALQLGYSTIAEISEKTGIVRTTVYSYIKNLIARGLISATERTGKLYYIASNPEKLKYLQEQQEQDVVRRRRILEDIIPELESIYNLAKDKPQVRFYDYSQARLDLMRQEIEAISAPEMYNIFNYARYQDFINKKHIQSVLDRVNKFKVIYISKHKVLDARVQTFLKNDKFRVRYLPEEKFGFLCEILIANDRVYISRDKDSLLITDKLFSQTLSLLFHALWGLSEEI